MDTDILMKKRPRHRRHRNQQKGHKSDFRVDLPVIGNFTSSEILQCVSSNGSTTAKKSRHRRIGDPVAASIDVSTRMRLQNLISDFLESSNETCTMSAELTKQQRAYVHEYSRKVGLISRSSGKGAKRQLTVYKPVQTKIEETSSPSYRILTDDTEPLVENLLRLSGPMMESCDKILQTLDLEAINRKDYGSTFSCFTKKFIPPHGHPSRQILASRLKLPITAYRDAIVKAIEMEQVVIVSGDTGSGKSTQLPQYLLEYSSTYKIPCRILCTQPRRIAAVSVAERVSQERGERLGATVGYQIRLENKFQQNTNLIYATSGCFIRSLTGDANAAFQGLTHLVIDEIHERDKNTDFLLIALRDYLATNKSLKVILMSATMNIQLLCDYFPGSHVFEVPGRCFETRTFFLEDVLYYLNYETAKMRAILASMPQDKSYSKNWPKFDEAVDVHTDQFVDELIQSCCEEPEEAVSGYFDQLLYLIEGEGLSVNLRHKMSGCTPLIAAAKRNNLKYLHIFLERGADPQLIDGSGMMALDYARMHEDTTCLERLNQLNLQIKDAENKSQRILLAYQQQTMGLYEEVDHDLLLVLLSAVNNASSQGSILVFLPGYNDMMIQKERIECEFKPGSYRLYLIHGSMSTRDQQAAFQPINVRKIILATNIAETSITFPDVSYVVDTGRVKQNVYVSRTGSNCLQSVRISKACALQRAGRAGRTQTGICYRLYSSEEYAAMSEFAVPELLRISLTEICLYAKAISGAIPIAEYLSKAIEPPTKPNILQAIEKLVKMGALDNNEEMTILGKRLVKMPVDVQLGKCLLFAIFFRCFEPVLTIAAYYSAKDPFLLSPDRTERGRVNRLRKELCENVMSDHLGIIRLYQKWRQSQQLRTETHFLADHNLSKASLETMSGVRRQILEHFKRTALPRDIPYKMLNGNSNKWNVIQACLTAGLYPNVAFVDRSGKRIRTEFDKSVAFHRTSVLQDASRKNEQISLEELPTDWLIFSEKSRVGPRALIRYNTMVTTLTIALFARSFEIDQESSDSESDNKSSESTSTDDEDYEAGVVVDIPGETTKLFVVDDWISFNVQKAEYVLLMKLKMYISKVFRIFLHGDRHWNAEHFSEFIKILTRILYVDSGAHFGSIKQPFDDSYLPKRYDTMTNIKHFQDYAWM